MNQGESQMLDGAMVEISFAKECVFYDFNYIIIVWWFYIVKNTIKPIDKNNHNQLAKVGARALAALQHGVDPNGQQQFLVYPTMGKFENFWGSSDYSYVTFTARPNQLLSYNFYEVLEEQKQLF